MTIIANASISVSPLFRFSKVAGFMTEDEISIRSLPLKERLLIQSLVRFRHQFRPRFSFSEARVAGGKTRLPQLVHALQQSFHHRRTGRLPAPQERRPYHRRNSQPREQQFNWRQAREAVKIKWRHHLRSIRSLSWNDSVRFGERTRLGCLAGRPARHFGAREYPDRSPTGGGAGRNTRGRVCSPKELNRSGQVSRSNAATIQP